LGRYYIALKNNYEIKQRPIKLAHLLSIRQNSMDVDYSFDNINFNKKLKSEKQLIRAANTQANAKRKREEEKDKHTKKPKITSSDKGTEEEQPVGKKKEGRSIIRLFKRNEYIDFNKDIDKIRQETTNKKKKRSKILKKKTSTIDEPQKEKRRGRKNQTSSDEMEIETDFVIGPTWVPTYLEPNKPRSIIKFPRTNTEPTPKKQIENIFDVFRKQ
jgi:hypothetical protein